ASRFHGFLPRQRTPGPPAQREERDRRAIHRARLRRPLHSRRHPFGHPVGQLPILRPAPLSRERRLTSPLLSLLPKHYQVAAVVPTATNTPRPMLIPIPDVLSPEQTAEGRKILE